MKAIGLILGVILLAGIAGAWNVGLTITEPVEEFSWKCYVIPGWICYKLPENSDLTLKWEDHLMHDYFTVNVYTQGFYVGELIDGKLTWKEYPTIDETYRVPGHLRKLTIPAEYIKENYRDAEYDITICNDWQQCDEVTVWKSWDWNPW